MQYCEKIYELFSLIKTKKLDDFFKGGFSGMFVALKILNDKNSPLSAGELAQYLDVSTARIAVILDSLEKKGLIEKSKLKNDGRVTLVSITDSGKEIISKRKKLLFETIDNLLSKLTIKERDLFFGLLQKLFS